LIDGTDSDIYQAIVRLLDGECRARVACKPFTIKGHDYAPGAVLLRNHENPEDLPARLAEAVTDLALTVLPVDTALSEKGPDLGGNRFRLLAQPRVAIASQWPVSTTSFGSVWHLLDVRTGLRSSPINTQSLGRIDLRKYNVLLLPHAWNTSGFGAVLNEPARKKLKSWVEAGGTLIAMGHTAAFLADAKQGLSSTRRKRDVLDKLAAYEEDLKREDAARAVQVDLEEVWGTSVPPPGDDKATPTKPEDTGKPNGKKDIEALKRKDAWERIFRPTGAIAAARTNTEHWLCFGVGGRLPVLLFGRYAYMSKHPVATPVRLADEADLRLSGLLWPEARSRWAQTAYATIERVGNGQVILFAFDPFFRGYFEGSGRLLLNAVILGPGLGTSQPAPW
jgi:hypothetical protein